MAYSIKHGIDRNARTERLETATSCLERVNALQIQGEANIKIFNREGIEITPTELERLSAKELI
jgi:Ulp1 family protease